MNKQLMYVGLLAGLALLLALAITQVYVPIVPPPRSGDYDVQGFLLVALGLAIVVILVVIPQMSKGQDGEFLSKFLIVAVLAQFAGTLTRLWVTMEVYGLRDAGRYDRAGRNIAQYIWDLRFDAIAPYVALGSSGWGTRFTEFYTGVVYAVIGPTVYGGYLLFGFFAFLGSCFYYKAFRIAFPEGRYRLYALLVFLFPSTLYWSNGIGKDALVVMFMGIASYGCALVLRRTAFTSMIPLAVGLAGTATIRPHLTGMVVLALMAAILVSRGRGGLKSRALQAAVLVAGIALVMTYSDVLMNYVGLDELSQEAAESFFDQRQRSTGGGGSAFDAPSASDPLFVPKAIVTMLARPFPWEARNIQMLIQSLDGVLVVGLLIWRSPDLFRAVRDARGNPYVIFIIAYGLMLSVSLMTIANFGTLARQRDMLLPLFFMLLAFSPPAEERNSKQSPKFGQVGRGAVGPITLDESNYGGPRRPREGAIMKLKPRPQ